MAQNVHIWLFAVCLQIVSKDDCRHILQEQTKILNMVNTKKVSSEVS